MVVLARDIVLPRHETRSEAANAPASDTAFVREICAEGVPLPSLAVADYATENEQEKTFYPLIPFLIKIAVD